MIAVYDDVLPDPEAYRAAALARTFGSVDVGHATFHGIAPAADTALLAWLTTTYPRLQPTLSFFRRSPAGQVEPNFIHNDVDMGDVTGILYLTDPPVEDDGTCFWWHADGRIDGPLVTGAAGEDLAAWTCYRTVPAVFNRAVVFDAPLYHSRALHANYGTGEDARLIQVVFGRWEGS